MPNVSIAVYVPPGRCPGLWATFGLTARPNHLPGVCANWFIYMQIFFAIRKKIFPKPVIVFTICQEKFITNLLTRITNFVTRVTKFLTSVTKFVTKILLYERKNYLADSKNYLADSDS